MPKKCWFAITVTAISLVLWPTPGDIAAQTAPPAAPAGQVSSQEEGPMEGVLVSAARAGSIMTVSVATDEQGRYRFPRNRLEPGRYSLRIRAIGYEMDPINVDVTTQKSAQADLKLHKVQDISAQLTNAEWLMSIPGPEERKQGMLGCTTCHTLERIVRSRHDGAAFMKVMQRMASYASGSQPKLPQFSKSAERAGGSIERFRTQAGFLGTINLSKVSKWEYSFKTLPRPTGRATRLIVTEYKLPWDLPQPHDVIVGSDGMVWYSDFGQQFLGKLDPKTGKTTDYPVPELKPGFPKGGLDLEEDKNGNLWLTLLEQGGIVRFDRKTEKFQVVPVPKEFDSDQAHISMLAATNASADGKVWFKDDAAGIILHRLDVSTGTYDTMRPYGAPDGPVLIGAPGRHGAYGITSDSRNNLFINDMGGSTIVRVDATTKELKFLPTPTPNAAPRRGNMDSQDRFWIAEFRGNKVAMLDTRTEKYQEWQMPTPWSNPYDAIVDKNGDVWTGGMSNDRVVRLNTKTGQATEYLLPSSTNIRRVFVDNSTTPPSFWVGNNQHASIVKLEPMD